MWYATGQSLPRTSIAVCLMCAQGKEPLYERLGFRRRPREHEGAAMVLEINAP